MQPETVVPSLVESLDERNLLSPVTAAIAAYGPAARSAVPQLATALLRALATTEYREVDCLVQAIEATADDPGAEIQQVLDNCDEELRPVAEHILADRRRRRHRPCRPRRGSARRTSESPCNDLQTMAVAFSA